ncbi:hypothetical protein B0H67DRAFT_550665 [Lasiosphaeris hirsuta]|uniref:FAD-binding domain-containing protein n=1 Tax=Lasiosphaeris hirsuta TaxID=260670 RepID=A0AA40E780_9PEZI|nr:hypothetical protein B0H67DRAFT_550665 [Lasiosphaeris hirsuta]
MPITKIIIVGAGPSGLLLALLLARAGITVELLEQTSALDTNPRASHYTAESCYEFDRAGILGAVEAEGFFPNGVSWRRLDDAAKTRLVALRMPEPAPGQEKDEAFRYRMVCLPLHRLGKILEEAVGARPEAEIMYGYKVVEIGQKEGSAWVKVETPGGRWRRGRRIMWLGVTGRTIVATNVYYDFEPYDYDDSQFFVHPEHWHMVAKIEADGLYRVTYGETAGLTHDELKARQPAKFAALLPGNPTPDQYKLVNFSPYKVHQRCVDKMRVGRFLLAADAAHLCNPFGGLGLTGGIADVGTLYDSFVGIHTGKTDADFILDKYDEVRRRIWHDAINPQSKENMMRLFSYADADEAMEKDPFYKMLAHTVAPKKEEAEPEKGGLQPNPGLMSLRYDITQHYSSDKPSQ